RGEVGDAVGSGPIALAGVAPRAIDDRAGQRGGRQGRITQRRARRGMDRGLDLDRDGPRGQLSRFFPDAVTRPLSAGAISLGAASSAAGCSSPAFASGWPASSACLPWLAWSLAVALASSPAFASGLPAAAAEPAAAGGSGSSGSSASSVVSDIASAVG